MELVVRLQEAQESQRQFVNTLAAQLADNQRQHDQVLQGLADATARNTEILRTQKEANDRRSNTKAGKMSDTFAGTYADWPGWKEKVETHFAPTYDRGQEILDWAAELGDTEVTPAMIRYKAAEMDNTDIEKMDSALYSGLMEVLKADTESFRIVQNSGKNRGLNAWRRLN